MPPSQPGVAANPRPPTAGSDKQIASSNATANAFLGGRQPSWMSSGAPPRKPFSRPAAPRPPAVQAIAHEHHQQHHQQQPAVLPSPAPSDEPSPALSNYLDSPKPNPASLADVHNMGSTTAATPATLPVTDARFVHDPSDSLDAQEIPGPGIAGSPTRVENRSPAFGYLFQPPSNGGQDGQNRHNRNMSYDGGSVPSRGPVPSPKRRRTDQSSSAPVNCSLLLPVLEQYIQSCGGEKALGSVVEKPRVMLLRQACEAEDEFFLVLHQLFCMWSLNLPEAYTSLPVSPQTADSAFRVLESVLKKNEFISATHQLWFSRFPVAPGQFGRGPVGGPAVVMQIGTFLSAFIRKHEALLNLAVQRNYPFLVDELLGHLNCYSPVLQYILFTACRRRLGVPEGHFGSRMEQAFRDDQTKHQHPVTGQHILLPTTRDEEVEQRNAALIRFYKHTVEAALSRGPNQPNLGSPPIPSTPVLQHPDFSSVQNAQQQQHQAVSSPYSSPNTFPQAYPSSALPPFRHAPMAATNPYTGPQATVRAGTQVGSPSSGTQAPQQHRQMSQSPPVQYRAGNNIPNPQSQNLPQQYILQQQQQQQAIAQHLGAHQVHQQQAMTQRQQKLASQQLASQQLASQLASRQLNQQQFQQNMQIAAGFAAQASLRLTTQPPTMAAHPPHGAQPPQNIHPPQMQPNPFIPQAQSVTSPTNSTPNGAHPGLGPAAQARSQQIQRDAVQRHRELRAKDPLLPPKGSPITRPEWPYDPADRKSVFMSLHQAHVRSPKRVLKDGETERCYQAVKSLPLPPMPVAPKKTMYEFRFVVTEEQYAQAAAKSKAPGSLLPVVHHFNGALRWRIRCCVVPSSSNTLTEEQWVTLDVGWPSYIHMTLNGNVLDIRRQTHNGRDLPTEITDFIVSGTNVLMVAIHDSQGEKGRNRHLAVEMLETLSHSTIVNYIWSQGATPEQKTLDTIKKRLTASADDEVAFEAPDLSIDLADPFSSTIFKIPARGVACTHMECFDLENWLNTRPAKAPSKCPHKQIECACNNSAEPSNPDKWRCPICSKDARPYSLRVDEFLLKVRAQLEEEGKLHTKSMRVKADGSWSVVLETDDEGSDGEVAAAAAVKAKAKAAQAPAVRREVEVIELD